MAVTVKSGQLGLATPFGELLGASTAEMNAELDDYVAMGVDWLRIDIHWDLVQPTANGGYNWSLVDKVFHAAADRGIEIIAVPNNFPNWVDGTFSTTSSQTAYANFAKAAAQHFGDLVDYSGDLQRAQHARDQPGELHQDAAGRLYRHRSRWTRATS